MVSQLNSCPGCHRCTRHSQATLAYWQDLLAGRKARLERMLELDAPDVLVDQERALIVQARSQVQRCQAVLS